MSADVGSNVSVMPAVTWKSGASAPRKAQEMMWALAPEGSRRRTSSSRTTFNEIYPFKCGSISLNAADADDRINS
jgi:hypothetical protein